MNYMDALKLYLISSRLRSTVLTRMRSKAMNAAKPSSDTSFREEIGVLTSLPLLRNVVEDLEAARNNGDSSLTLYFTKESHIHTLVNLVLLSGLPIANRRIPELDYAVCGNFK
jgi:Histidine phosphatase superfamily (branch 2)